MQGELSSSQRHVDAANGAAEHPSVAIVIPVKNEARNLPHVLGKLSSYSEIILVDGSSTDGTVDVARKLRPDIKVVHQPRRGKGNALACGFAAASSDIIVMLDADGSADPAEIGNFVRVLAAGADFAKGSRRLSGGGSTDLTRIRQAGNAFFSGLVNIIFGCRYTDLCYGYNAFWRHCLPAIDLAPGPADGITRWGDGFEVETMINIRLAAADLRIVEVPSFEYPRIHGVSNLNAFSDGLRVLTTILREWRRVRPVPQWAGVAATFPRASATVPAQRVRTTAAAVRNGTRSSMAGQRAGGRTWIRSTKNPGD